MALPTNASHVRDSTVVRTTASTLDAADGATQWSFQSVDRIHFAPMGATVSDRQTRSQRLCHAVKRFDPLSRRWAEVRVLSALDETPLEGAPYIGG